LANGNYDAYQNSDKNKCNCKDVEADLVQYYTFVVTVLEILDIVYQFEVGVEGKGADQPIWVQNLEFN